MQKGPYFNPVQYISPLPEGYLQASSNIANTLGKAMQGFGENIASGIEKYTKNQEESALLDAQAPRLLESLKRYAATAKDEKDIAHFSEMGDKLTKMPGQSLTQKRAIVSGLMADLSLYDKRQQFEINQNQLAAQKQAFLNQEAYTQSLGGPTTRDVQSQVPMSGLRDQSQYLYDQNQPPPQQQAQPVFMNSLAAIQANRPQPSAAPIAQPQAAQINPAAFAQQAPQAAFDPSTILPNISRAFTQTKDNPYGTDYFSNAKQPISGPPQAQVAQQAPIAAPTPAAQVSPPVSAQQPVAAQRNLPSASQFDQSFNQNIDRVGQTSERTVTDNVDLTPKELYTNQLASYIAKGGQVTPELNAQFKKDAGVKAAVDVKVQQVKDEKGNSIGSIILQDGEVKHFVATPDAKGLLTQEQMLKLKENTDGRSITFNGQKWLAPTTDEAKEFRAAVSSHEDVVKGVRELVALNKDPSVKIVGSAAYNKAESIAAMLQGSLRITLTGPGAVNASEYKLMDKVISNPSAFFSLSSSNQERLLTLLDTTNSRLTSKAKSLGFTDSSNATYTGENNSNAGQPVSKKDSTGRSYTIQRY